MRKSAANIVVKDIATTHINHVIEIDNGTIVNDYPLLKEIEAVEWIGGMIVCSTYKSVDKINNIKISDFIKRYSNHIYAKESYAWHISGIDISEDSVMTDRNLSLLQ